MSEIGELKRELLALRAEVAALRCRVEVLESIGEFEVVRGEDPPLLGEGTEGFGTTSASAATTSAVAVAPGAREPAPLADSGVAEGWGERAEVAKEIGQFLKRGLAGEIVPSGRSKLGLKSRLYLLVRDKQGIIYKDPVRIFRSWRSLRPLVEERGELGNSLFIGVPSEFEGKIAVKEAGLTWPASFEG